MEIPNKKDNVSDEDEKIRQRLIEVDNDAKDFFDKEKKKKQRNLIIWGILIALTILFILAEYSGKTSVCNTFKNITKVANEEKPADNKVVPMHYGGKSPMLISGNNFKEQVEKDISQLPPPPPSGENSSSKEKKAPEWFNETAKQ